MFFKKLSKVKNYALHRPITRMTKKELKLLLDYIEKKVDILYNKYTEQTDINKKL